MKKHEWSFLEELEWMCFLRINMENKEKVKKLQSRYMTRENTKTQKTPNESELECEPKIKSGK